jgi:hypothetical protein
VGADQSNMSRKSKKTVKKKKKKKKKAGEAVDDEAVFEQTLNEFR